MPNSLVTATGLSPSLRSALARIESAQPGERSSISSQMNAEAREAMKAVEAALQPAGTERAERWLEALGALVSAAQGEAEAARKIHAMATMLDFPASAYTRRSLDAAARRFRFFPSYAELCEHLEAETAEAKRMRHQLRRLLAQPVEDDRPPPRYSDLSAEQRAEVDRHLANLRSLSARPEIGPQGNETGAGAI